MTSPSQKEVPALRAQLRALDAWKSGRISLAPGEGFRHIAALFGKPWEELAAANPWAAQHGVYNRMNLLIPRSWQKGFEVDQYGNIVKKPLSPCEQGDSRFHWENGGCVPNPVPAGKVITSIAHPTAVGKTLALPCPPVTVHVWRDSYSTVAYVTGTTDPEAYNAAICVGKLINAGPPFGYGAYGDGDKCLGPHGWTGPGRHVRLPVAWYKNLKSIGIQGLP